MILTSLLLKANDDIVPKEERSSIIEQVIGNQQIHFLKSYYCYYYCGWLWYLYAKACCGIVISCIRATQLTKEETLPPLPTFQAMKIGLFLI